MENIMRFLNGESATHIWSYTGKPGNIAEPAPAELTSPDFEEFVQMVKEDAMGAELCKVA